MRSCRIAATVLAAMVGLAAGTHAVAASPVVEATGKLTGLTYRLIDLDESDGITPWIQFNPNSVLLLAAGRLDEGESRENMTTVPGSFFAAPAAARSTADGSAWASHAGSTHTAGVKAFDDDFQNGTAVGSFSEIAHFYGSDFDPNLGLPTPLENEFGFTLSANTALAIEATANFSSRINGSLLQGTTFEKSLADKNGYARLFSEVSTDFGAYLDGYYPDQNSLNTVDNSASFGISTGVYLDPGDVWTDVVDIKSQFLQATIQNTSGSEVSGSFFFNLTASMDIDLVTMPDPSPWTPPVDPSPVDPIPSIPEPSTYALMLLGLVGVGAVARRQRRIATTH